jgi:amino acid transporter
LLMYIFLSPITALAMSDFGAAMKDSVIRFWAVEHTFVNIIAIGLAQTGSILVKKFNDSAKKNKRTLIWTGIALLLILAMIPMGMMGVERPWFRF